MIPLVKTKPIAGDAILTYSGMGLVLAFTSTGFISYVRNYKERHDPATENLENFVELKPRVGVEHVTWVMKDKNLKFEVSFNSKQGVEFLGSTVAHTEAKALANALYKLGCRFTDQTNLKVPAAKKYITEMTGASVYDNNLMKVKLVGYQ